MRTKQSKKVAALALLLALCAACLPLGLGGVLPVQAAGIINLTALNTPYGESFDTLASTGTANAAVPTGWDFAEAGTNANALYRAGRGSDNAGDTYSFGSDGSSERAFGGLQSGSLIPAIGAQFANNTGATIESLSIAYSGEQWRLGQNTAGRLPDRLDFQISVDATSLTTGNWTNLDALDFNSPVLAGTVGALDGNTNSTQISFAITGLSIANGASFWLRWADYNVPGSDDGLAVDNFSLTAQGTVPADDAPTVSATSPVNGASSVPLNANLTVTFSEPVNAAPSSFSLLCSASGAKSVTVSGGPTEFTLDPDSDFVNGDTCTLSVPALGVTDQDAIDPPDNMATDFAVTFGAGDACAATYTPIPQIQGAGDSAAITGPVTTKGVVVGDYEGPSPALRGFYLQDQSGDGDPATSDAIFVFNGDNDRVSLGEIVLVSGAVAEFQGQTQIGNISNIVSCGLGSVTPVDVTLPFESAAYPERYEGMLVRLPQTLYVTEHFQLGRFGQVVLSSGGRLPQPTNIVPPGAPALAQQAANNLNRIIVDDALNNQNPDPIVFGRGGQPLSGANTLRGGDTVSNVVGVLTYTWAGNSASGNAYRLRPINALGGGMPDFQPSNPRPQAAPALTGRLRVAGMNLLNFFNTFDGLPDNVDNCTLGVGGGATDCRGADTQTEFDRQWPKTVAAILGTDAAVIGVNEVENDGYGPDSALATLVNQLNAQAGAGTYAFIDVDAATGQTNALGTDAIKVGMIYKPAIVTPAGQTAALNSVEFVNGGDREARNRPALAQAFSENSTGETFVMAINHLKSKGSPCDAPDAGDGQGNCAAVRTVSANLLAQWLAADPTGTGDPDVLIIGDLNSYAQEDPITALRNAGYTNLIEQFNGLSAYSYVFDGQWGYLDHALGNAALVPQVAGVSDWHINADEPSALDYNTDFKSAGQVAGLYAPDPFRIADHDPVLVDLNLAVNTPPSVGAITGPSGPVKVNTPVTVSAAFSDPDVQDTHTAVWDWGDGTTSEGMVSEANGSGSVSGEHLYAAPGTYTVVLTVTDNDGSSAQASTQVVVYAANGGFVLGAGWLNSPAGAYQPNPDAQGRALLSFLAQYPRRSSTVPTGYTQFTLLTQRFVFESSSYDWLVITETTAQYTGSGRVNGRGSYGFLLTVSDGRAAENWVDKVRLQIWDKNAGNAVIYDSQLGAPNSAAPTTTLQGVAVVFDGRLLGLSAAEGGEDEELGITDQLYMPFVTR